MKLKELRILQLIDSLEVGGAERMAVNLGNTFTEQNIVNKLIVSRNDGPLTKLVLDQESVQILGKNSTFDFRAFRKLISVVKNFKPDLFHVHGTSIYWGVCLKFFFPKVKLIWHDHLGISSDVIAKNPRSEMRWLGNQIDFIITANESTADYWKEKKIINKSAIKYLPNFPYLKIEEKVKTDLFTFLHLANFRSEKGQLNVVNACKILKEKGLSFKVRMIGQSVDKTWKESISSRIKELELETVAILEGPTDDVASVLTQVNAGLVASDREGLPVALLEYGLAGLPVISTNVGQCSEVLGNGEFGILVPPNDSEALANAMEGLMALKDKGLSLGESFLTQVKNHFGEVQFISEYQKVIKSIVK